MANVHAKSVGLAGPCAEVKYMAIFHGGMYVPVFEDALVRGRLVLVLMFDKGPYIFIRRGNL